MSAAAVKPYAYPAVTSVLVLEKNELLSGVAAARFEGLGAKVVKTARNAQQARALLQTTRFDFAMLDVISAGIEMESVVRELESSDIPFVFTAEGMGGMSAGEQRYAWIRIVAKPYSDGDLLEAMDGALAGQDLTLTL